MSSVAVTGSSGYHGEQRNSDMG